MIQVEEIAKRAAKALHDGIPDARCVHEPNALKWRFVGVSFKEGFEDKAIAELVRGVKARRFKRFLPPEPAGTTPEAKGAVVKGDRVAVRCVSQYRIDTDQVSLRLDVLGARLPVKRKGAK